MEPSEVDLAHVADLLRTRRRALQPEDVGLPRGPRRRTPGLRREEAAELCSMSADYYRRLERRQLDGHCGPRPSPRMLASIARGLRFTRADRDRLFAAAGYAAGEQGDAHLDPGVMHVLSRLADTPAQAFGPIGEMLHQTRSARALFGDLTGYTGWARSGYYRWFTDPEERRCHPIGEHHVIGTEIAADLRRSKDRCLDDRAADLVRLLLHRSAEFAAYWRRTPPVSGVRTARRCRVVHPEVGVIDLQREVLFDGDLSQRVVIYLAVPGTGSHTKLKLSTVIGHHRFDG